MAPRPRTHRPPRWAWRTAVVAVLGLAAAVTAGAPGSAVALPTSPGSASAQSAAVVNGTGVKLTSTGTGVLGTLTAPLSGLISTAATLPTSAASVAAGALTTTAGLQASNASTSQPRPTPVSNYPICNQSGWTSPNGNCFAVVPSAATPTLGASSLVALSAGTVQGYATGDDQGYVAAAGSSHPILAVPGLLIDLGVASSDSQCSTTTCAPEHAFTSGAITTSAGTQGFALASGSGLATVGSTSIASGVTVPVVPNLISATANGKFLTFTVTLSLAQLLAALGTTLSALGAGLAGTLGDNGSTVALAVTIGPGDITGATSTTAGAWGLEVGINLIADLKFNLTGTPVLGQLLGSLLGSTELQTVGASAYPATPGSSPDLLDLKFAYSAATAGLLLPGWLPPNLI